MKYFNLAVVSIALMGLGFMSCESNAEINVDELETVCDHVNACDDIATEMLDIRGTDDVKDLDADTKKQYEKLEKKLDEVNKTMKKKFKKSEAKKCPDFDLAMRKMKDL